LIAIASTAPNRLHRKSRLPRMGSGSSAHARSAVFKTRARRDVEREGARTRRESKASGIFDPRETRGASVRSSDESFDSRNYLSRNFGNRLALSENRRTCADRERPIFARSG